MNEYQTKLYNNLMELVQTNEAFYFADFEDGVRYRIFNYRLASYSDFLKPGALECRGVMFEIHGEGYGATPVRLASLPMEKFFNLNENPFTMNLDLSTVVELELKADGSLMSTYLHPSKTGEIELRLKSKGSIASEQCLHAMKLLARDENRDFFNELRDIAMFGATVNMEWCAPQHRIVLGYEKPQLSVLNVRLNATGQYLSHDDLWAYPKVAEHLIERLTTGDPERFIKLIPDMQGIEGYVLRLASGQRVKIKTAWYLALHHTKDSINSPRRLFEAVLEEATDDMKSMFHDDPLAIKMIAEMETFVEKHFNHMVDTVERFYERNKGLDRKDYAILGQQELDRMHFGLAMNKYTGKEVDYKGFLKKKWKDLGLKDTDNDEEEDTRPPRERKPSKKDVRKAILGK